MSADEWKKRCEDEWGLRGVPMPDTVDWRLLFGARPFGRNLLKNPAPHGLTHNTPPPEPELTEVPVLGPPRFEPEGDFTSWTTSKEVIPFDTSMIPPGGLVCHWPQYSWFSMEQLVDLKAEGLWKELLDDFQPDIVIQDWYEESQVHKSIYQLRVKLLGADRKTVISEFFANPTEDLSTYSHTWKEVLHVFSGYPPGVRYVHFLHQLKNKFMMGFFPTLVTDSSVTIKPTRSNH